jgi:hypothetical protein
LEKDNLLADENPASGIAEEVIQCGENEGKRQITDCHHEKTIIKEANGSQWESVTWVVRFPWQSHHSWELGKGRLNTWYLWNMWPKRADDAVDVMNVPWKSHKRNGGRNGSLGRVKLMELQSTDRNGSAKVAQNLTSIDALDPIA